jgi:hypothetical protein
VNERSYPAARVVAVAVEAQFARHLAAARAQGDERLAPAPDAASIEAIVDAAFWASLRREEDHIPRISLVFLPPEQAGEPLLFERQLPLAPRSLTRLAPAVERPGIHLGVWPHEGELKVWGTTRSIPRLCFALEVAEPGLLVIKYRRDDEYGKFGNVAVLEGDEIKVVDEGGASLPDCPSLITSLLGFHSPASHDESVNVLVQLAVSMRAHRRGGSLLVVPRKGDHWRESIVRPIPYSVVPAFGELARLMRHEAVEGAVRSWQEAVRRQVDAIAGLTAVDGATIISEDYDLLAFGAKIGRPIGGETVEKVAVTEPVVGDEPVVLHPAQIGGTRHLSAAQFVHDQPDSLALVASQDGRFTIFAWSPCEGMVHAHRVETLLL